MMSLSTGSGAEGEADYECADHKEDDYSGRGYGKSHDHDLPDKNSGSGNNVSSYCSVLLSSHL